MSSQPKQLDSQYTKGRFSGKVAIVTGGASGIGRATVQRFANDGAKVALFDVNQSAGEKVQTELRTAGHHVKFYKVDVSDKQQCVEAVKKVAQEHEGKIHFLVNNAGIRGDQGLKATKADWDRVLGVNTVGYANMVQSCHPFMKNRPWECAVVNIASTLAHRACEGVASWTYQASKGAVFSLTKGMALDLSADGIRVNSISPGDTWTDMQTPITDGGNREKWEPIIAKYEMLRRYCEPEEVAAGIAFLCSRDASFITGIDLPVDGGYLALGPDGLGGT